MRNSSWSLLCFETSFLFSSFSFEHFLSGKKQISQDLTPQKSIHQTQSEVKLSVGNNCHFQHSRAPWTQYTLLSTKPCGGQRRWKRLLGTYALQKCREILIASWAQEQGGRWTPPPLLHPVGLWITRGPFATCGHNPHSYASPLGPCREAEG